MRKLGLALGLLLVAAATMGADYPALPDGGSRVTSNTNVFPGDGGGPWVIIDTYHVDTDWLATLRCSSARTSPRVYYRFSQDGGVARDVDALLDLDRTFDIPITQPRGGPLRYLSLLGEDGGAPDCNLHHQTPPY